MEEYKEYKETYVALIKIPAVSKLLQNKTQKEKSDYDIYEKIEELTRENNELKEELLNSDKVL